MSPSPFALSLPFALAGGGLALGWGLALGTGGLPVARLLAGLKKKRTSTSLFHSKENMGAKHE